MKLTDTQIEVFVAKVLHLVRGKRKEYIDQVDNLIGGAFVKCCGLSILSKHVKRSLIPTFLFSSL